MLNTVLTKPRFVFYSEHLESDSQQATHVLKNHFSIIFPS
jgi:hypothetical protein